MLDWYGNKLTPDEWFQSAPGREAGRCVRHAACQSA